MMSVLCCSKIRFVSSFSRVFWRRLPRTANSALSLAKCSWPFMRILNTRRSFTLHVRMRVCRFSCGIVAARTAMLKHSSAKNFSPRIWRVSVEQQLPRISPVSRHIFQRQKKNVFWSCSRVTPSAPPPHRSPNSRRANPQHMIAGGVAPSTVSPALVCRGRPGLASKVTYIFTAFFQTGLHQPLSPP